jgi:predicted TIM-barrel fold metal-dependent hydrolase
VLDTIAIFGVDRCLFASNFPVDRLASDYDAIWQAFDEITADFSEAERGSCFTTMRRISIAWASDSPDHLRMERGWRCTAG